MTQAAIPIRRRLSRLHDQWVAFADNPEARVLCWCLRDDERSMLAAFFAKEEDERSAELADLFLAFDLPFASADSYGFALRQALIEMTQGEPDSDLAAGAFVPPALARNQSSLAALLATCAAFRAHFALPAQLVLVLAPSDGESAPELATFLREAARLAPAEVRFIFRDASPTPSFAGLSGAPGVVIQHAELDMPSALLEVSRAAGGLDTPGGMYRHLYVALSAALGRGDLAAADALCTRLLAITRPLGWFALEVPVQLAAVGPLMQAGRTQDALARCVGAEQSAALGTAAGDATCDKLHMQARLVRGGLLLSTEAYEKAHTLFVETLPMALALGDALSAIDCHRLASFSKEQAGDPRSAWKHGLDALGYARGLDVETRRSSTLKFMAEGMQRLGKRAEFRAQAGGVQREFERLLAEEGPKPRPEPPAVRA